jgi:hypothetical protein
MATVKQSASTDFSTQHYSSASIFASRAAELETKYSAASYPRGTYVEHQAYASGGILAAVAFLEAYVNELFERCAAPYSSPSAKGLSDAEEELLGRMWRRGVPRTARYAILEKFDIALALLGREVFDRGAEPYQSAASLVRLRNALVHFEPEDYPVESPYSEPIERADMPNLQKDLAGRFDLNPLARDDYPFFPDKCLSAGCVSWTISSSYSFGEAFLSRLGVVESYKDPFGTPPR